MKLVKHVLVSVIGGAMLGLAAHAADTNKTSGFIPPSEVVRPSSLFDDKSSSVRDPFYPKSTRPPYVALKIVSTPNTPPPPPTFNLKGILGAGTNRLALINNQTLAEGESASVKTGGRQVRIRCIKIGDRSVTVVEEGKNEPIELHLQDK